MTPSAFLPWAIRTAFLYGLCSVAAGADDAARIPFNIEAGSMARAIVKYMEQSHRNVLTLEPHLEDIHTPAVKGLHTREEALGILTAHTGLCYEFLSDGSTATLKRCPDPKPQPPPGPAQKPLPPPENPTPGELLSVTVRGTGTNIPGLKPWLFTGPESIILTHEDLIEQGITRLSDLNSVLTQLFGGGPSQDTHLIGAETRTNTGLGTAYNLRGLGARATLVLLNGRRLAPSGSAGSFTDNLNIPISAIKRVEFLTDGVSAIYGADAVAGVVNIITEDSEDRGETTAHVGMVAQGAWKEESGSQSFSGNWNSDQRNPGGAFASVEYSRSTSLPERDRSFGSSDLRSNGGPDLDIPQAWPPDVVVGQQSWAVAPGFTGRIPSSSQLLSGTPNVEDVHANSDLWPAQEMTSAYGQVWQSMGDHLTLRLEGILTHRLADEADGGDRVNIPITSTSPYYLPSIARGAPMYVETDLYNALGAEVTHVDVHMMYGAAVASLPFGTDSLLTASVSRALETEHQLTTGVGNMIALTDPAVGFDPFAPASTLSAGTLAAIRAHSFFNQASELHEYNIQLSGPLFAHHTDSTVTPESTHIIGAIGIEYRTQTLSTGDSTLPISYDSYNRRTKAVYAEVTVPLLLQGTGSAPLELSAAGRYEDYSDFGHIAVPRVALRWNLSSDLRLLASLGRSIQTPNLPDLNTSRNTVSVGPPPSGTGEVIYLTGNDSRLQEEHATNAALEAIFTRDLSQESSVRLEAQLFSIDYYGRIQAAPDISDIGSALLTSPDYSSLVERNPSPAAVAQLCRSPQLYGVSTAQCLQGTYLAVVDLQLKNSDTLQTRGLDLQNTWTVHPHWGTVELQWAGTYIFRYADRGTPSAPFESLLNTQNNPINLQAHASVKVTFRDFTTDITTNFSNSYRDTASQPVRPVASWTTIDLRLQYTFRLKNQPPGQGWLVGFQVKNVANRNPPFLANYVERLGYDEENTDPLGRMLTAQLHKEW